MRRTSRRLARSGLVGHRPDVDVAYVAATPFRGSQSFTEPFSERFLDMEHLPRWVVNLASVMHWTLIEGRKRRYWSKEEFRRVHANIFVSLI